MTGVAGFAAVTLAFTGTFLTVPVGSVSESAHVPGDDVGGELYGLEDLREDAAGTAARGFDRAADDSEGDEQEEDDEPSRPGATVVPPDPSPEPEDDAEAAEEEEGAAQEPQGDLPGGFAPVSGCDADVPAEGSVANGQLGSAHLCEIGDDFLLRPDAAAAFLALADAYAEDTGKSLVKCIGNTYRSYDEQADLYTRKPGLAARPGTSKHGWGLAIDFECGANSYSSEFYGWLTANGAEYGWHNPGWAQPNGSNPEPWHWEFDPSLVG